MRTSLVAAALTLIGTIGLMCEASAAGPVTAVAVRPAARSFYLGAIELTALHDAQFVVANNGKVFGVGVGTQAVARVLRKAHLPTDRITLSVNVLMVRTGHRIVLLDSGVGPKLHGALLASLEGVGVKPSAVTDVLITHPHMDHIGGLTDAEGHLAFPRATIQMSKAAWAWLKTWAPPALINTLAVHIRTFEPGAQVAPGITSVSLPGHTPGHVGYEIISGNARLLDTGDIVHSSILSLAKPQWKVGFDYNPVLARATRLKTLASLAKSQEWVFVPHFPFPGVGHIKIAGDAYAWKPGIPKNSSSARPR